MEKGRRGNGEGTEDKRDMRLDMGDRRQKMEDVRRKQEKEYRR